MLLLVGFALLGSFAGERSAWFYATLLLAGAFVILAWVRWLAYLRGDPLPVEGGMMSLLRGVSIGLLASLGSAGLYYLVRRPTLAAQPATAFRLSSFIASLGDAGLEETAFRAGVVHLLASSYGPLSGLLGGSLPFGALHLLHLLLGRPVSLAFVLVVSLAGWLMSLLYLQSGLLAAFGAHWIWNAMVGFWYRLYQLPPKVADVQFEGDWTTAAVLAALCIMLHFWRPIRRTVDRAPPHQMTD